MKPMKMRTSACFLVGSAASPPLQAKASRSGSEIAKRRKRSSSGSASSRATFAAAKLAPQKTIGSVAIR